MDYGIADFLKLLGSLGIFLYGMKLMSEALQKVAGDKMRSILSAMTSNRVKGVFTGILITVLIQSSSATTVMVVSFVNAGLLSLIEAIGVIMGANIGTTVTAWIISILGFKVKMSALALPLIGLSLPLLFAKKRSNKSWGELVMGFALLFIGLEFLKGSVPDLKSNPAILEFLQHYTEYGYGSYIIFMLIGTILTIIIQSSSATMALTLVACSQGWIQFDMAAAMVLGENIGTTITANLAAMVANTSARRAARAHLIINLFGVIWVLAIFPWFLNLVTNINDIVGGGDPLNDPTSIPVALSIFHTTFNIINVCILIGGANFISKIVTKLVPAKENFNDTFNLKHIKIGMLSTPDASIFQAKQELTLYARNTIKMFQMAANSLSENKKDFDKSFQKLHKLEDDCDDNEIAIANYLTKVTETKLSTTNSKRVRAMFRIVSEMESIADSSFNIAKAVNRSYETKSVLPEELIKKLQTMFALIEEALEEMAINTATEYTNVFAKKAYELEGRINDYRTILRQEHILFIEEKKYPYMTGVIYSDIYSECEKIGDYAINVTQAITEIKEEN